MLATIRDSFEMGFILPSRFKSWLNESNSKKLCCFEYTYDDKQEINFNEIEDLLELKSKFEQIEEYEDKRIVKVKACKNIIKTILEEDEEE